MNIVIGLAIIALLVVGCTKIISKKDDFSDLEVKVNSQPYFDFNAPSGVMQLFEFENKRKVGISLEIIIDKINYDKETGSNIQLLNESSTSKEQSGIALKLEDGNFKLLYLEKLPNSQGWVTVKSEKILEITKKYQRIEVAIRFPESDVIEFKVKVDGADLGLGNQKLSPQFTPSIYVLNFLGVDGRARADFQ